MVLNLHPYLSCNLTWFLVWRIALTACREKCNQKKEQTEQIEGAISWYNRVLGFRIECGHGA